MVHAKFAYNDSVNKSSKKTPFQIIYGRSPKGVVDLVKSLDLEDKKGVDASDFANSMHELHEHVKQKL